MRFLPLRPALLAFGGALLLSLPASAQDLSTAAQDRYRVGDVEVSAPPGWAARQRGGALQLVRPTDPGAAREYVSVYPAATVRGDLARWLVASLEGRRETVDNTPRTERRGKVSYAWADTREPIGDGRELYRSYVARRLGDQAVMLVRHSIAGDPVVPVDEGLMYALGSVTIRGYALDRDWARALAAAGVDAWPPERWPARGAPPLPRPQGRVAQREPEAAPVEEPRPAPREEPAPTPAPAPRPAPKPPARGGQPNFVGTYFSWGTISAKLLILADGTWESGPSRGHWTYGGGRMVVLDGNARGWCGGRGILNEQETQLSFDCVSKDGFAMNVSFAKHSREIER